MLFDESVRLSRVNQKGSVEMIKKLRSLHDYVKQNYEAGNYDASAEEYKQWTNDYQSAVESDGHAGETSDFQMGYQQATTDHDHGFGFRDYPEVMINFGNIVSGNRLKEISDFIQGYNAAKKDIIDELK